MEDQKVLLEKHFGAKRFVYNFFLDDRKKTYLESKKALNYYDNAKRLTEIKHSEEYIWLNEINSQSLQSSLRDLDVAYTRFFSKQGQFPKFKSKHAKQSFRIPQFVEYKDGELWIPKFKKAITVKEDRPLTGEILFATISKTPTNRYFVSITCNTDYNPYAKNTNAVGVDLGIKDLAICSDGKVYENIKIVKKYEKTLAYEQRQLSKKQKGSKNRNKQRIKAAKLHEKIGNTRLDRIHKITTTIVRENQTICVENLSIKNMMKNHCLSKSISDISWGEFLKQLKYKSEWNGRNFVSINKFFPSSKTCNKCKFINQDLTLAAREWVCPNCGEELDRDLNASKNILEQGLNNLNSGSGMESESKQKLGEALPVKASPRAKKPKH